MFPQAETSLFPTVIAPTRYAWRVVKCNIKIQSKTPPAAKAAWRLASIYSAARHSFIKCVLTFPRQRSCV
jgi:hypothetical protein